MKDVLDLSKQGYRPTKALAWTTASVVALSLAFMPAIAQRLRFNAAETGTGLFSTFTPSGVDTKLAQKYKVRPANTPLQYRFTPAGIDSTQGRTITVAARMTTPVAAPRRAVVTQKIVANVGQPTAALADRLHKTDFRLTEAKGWKGFATANALPTLKAKAPISEVAARGGFKIEEVTKKPSRFRTDVKLDAARGATPSPRGNAAAGDYKLDVGGSFSISRRVAVTAGVSYKSERDRLDARATNTADNEAVYVGTKIRF